MKKRYLLIALIVVMVLFFFPSCSIFPSKGNVKVFIKDTPIDITKVDKILITISSVEAHKTGESWQTIFNGELTIDLKVLINNPTLISDVDLKAGKYTELRLVVKSGEIVIGGNTYELQVPSGEAKIPCVFDVKEAATVSITLDFEAENSIEVIQAGGSEKYILRPVIKVESITYQ